MLLLDNYLANPTHDIKIALVGVGGTGSHLLTELAGFSDTLINLGRKPLDITAYDPDKIERHNVNKQKFHESDIGFSKAEILVNRINRAYNSNLKFQNKYFDSSDVLSRSYNIIISCVDDVRSRRIIHDAIDIKKVHQTKPKNNPYNNNEYNDTLFYWIDCGNGHSYGQVIISDHINRYNLPTIIDKYPDLKDDPTEPSCSLAASLNQQSYNINKMVSILALNMLTTYLIDYQLPYSEAYINLNPLNIKTNKL